MPTEIDSLQIKIETKAGKAAKGIDDLIASLGRLKNVEYGDKLQKLSKALQPLQNLKLTGFASAMNSLKKIPDITKSLDAKTINAFAAACEKLSTALSPLASQMNKVGSSFTALPSTVRKTTQAMNAYSAAADDSEESTDKLGNILDDVRTKYAAVTGAVHIIGNTIGQWINNVNNYVENVNLFTVSMGSYADSAMAYAERVSELMGIDVSEWIRNQGVFMSIATGFGLMEDKAYALSKGLTELSYDISSFFNVSLDADDGAFAKVRSGLAGELEPLRALGYALDEATLQQVAYDHGVQMSIGTMTQAQKAMLRYTAIVEQSARMGVIGDLSRTLVTPANAIRILRAQIQQLTRALGSLFIPILIKVIPYVQAFTQIVTAAIQRLATLVGFELPTIDYSGLEKVAGSVEDTSTGLKEATNNVKKLKSQMLGIDELNVISPDDGSDSAGAGSGGGYGDDLGIDIADVWDESMLSNIQSEVDEIVEKMKPLLELAVGIGTAILAWKVGKAFLTGLESAKILLSDIAKKPGASSATTLFFGAGFSEKFMKFAEYLRKTPIGGLILGSGSTSIGAALAAVAAVVAAVGALVYGIVDVYKKSENFRTGLKTIFDGVVGLFGLVGDAFEWMGKQLGKIELPDGLKLAIDGLSDALSWAELSVGDFLIAAGGFALFGGWGLAILGVVEAIKFVGYAASDSLEPVDLFGEGISELTKQKVEPFLEKMDELEQTVKADYWGNVKITMTDVETIKTQLNEITTIIIDELDADKNAALAKLNPLEGALENTELTYDELVKKIEQSYAQQEGIVLTGKSRITAIYSKAAKENREITDEEAAEIEQIQREMKETGIKYLSESQTESNRILQALKDNSTQLSAEQASEIIKDAKNAKDETIKSANEQYKGIELEAQRMLDTGVINKEEYDAIIAAAKTTRNDTVNAANKQYDSIVKTAKSKMGEYAKYIDTETGEIKSNWRLWCEGLSAWWNNTWSNMKKLASAGWNNVTKWFEEKVKPWFTKEKWEEVFSGIKEGLEAGVKKALNKGIDLLNSFIGWVNDKMSFTIPGFEIGGMDIVNPITGKVKHWDGVELWDSTDVTLFTLPKITQKFADGGFIEDGLFTMNHGEIAGKFSNGKSVVANNEQIIAGISEGVYSAVVSAMQHAGGSSGEQSINVYLDGKQIYSSVKKTESERGKQLFGNQLGYNF